MRNTSGWGGSPETGPQPKCQQIYLDRQRETHTARQMGRRNGRLIGNDALLYLLRHAHSCDSPDAPLKSQAAFNRLTAFNTTCKSSGLNFALRTSFAKTAACALVTCSDRSPHEPMAKSLDDFSSLCAVASPFASKSSWVVCSSDRCGARCGRKMVNGDVSRNSVGVRRRGKAV